MTLRADGEPLIVDVGMHHGDDTAFYLAKGFRVIAVEANPVLAERGRRRFEHEIATGRLVIKEVAIARNGGTATFYVGSEDGWGSLDERRAGANLNVPPRQYDVEACTFESLLEDLVPYYVKVDIEGADLLCVFGVERLASPPEYFSFESDLAKPNETIEGLRALGRSGYTRFKLVNQALNHTLRCPSPPREGRYVDVRFSGEMSGLFGAESPGAWTDLGELVERFRELSDQQAIRARYAETGRVFGLPLGRFHSALKATYNAPPVRAARTKWAGWRGNELGGWFDVHAAR